MFSSPFEAGAAALVRLFLVRSRFVFVRALALSLALLLAPLHGHAQCDARLQCCATAPPGGDPDAGGTCGAEPAQLPGTAPGTGAGITASESFDWFFAVGDYKAWGDGVLRCE